MGLPLPQGFDALEFHGGWMGSATERFHQTASE